MYIGPTPARDRRGERKEEIKMEPTVSICKTIQVCAEIQKILNTRQLSGDYTDRNLSAVCVPQEQ